MLHLFDQVRAPIDDFERLLIKVFSEIPVIDAIWIREKQAVQPCPKRHPHASDATCPGVQKRYLRSVWLQLAHRSIAAVNAIHQLHDELQVRILHMPFALEVRWIVDELPPSDVAPSCVYRRG
ncbi:hypothetical protein Rctr197k_184 [Virus Rctr197k]|nr:hypothetical protein Rctr197k_184 [Virus Rctr197k]